MPTTVTTITVNRFAEIARRLPQETGQIVKEALGEIETDIKTGMAGPKSGRVYSRGTREHQASAPGEMPAVDYSNLVNSIQTEMDGETTGAVYTNVDYAPMLEWGTTEMEARPAWTPAAENARPEFIRKMSDLERQLG